MIMPYPSNVDSGLPSPISSTLITAVGATTTQVSDDQINMGGKILIVTLNTTAIGSGSITLTVQGKDPASGSYYTILSGSAVTTNTINVYTVIPGAFSVTGI